MYKIYVNDHPLVLTHTKSIKDVDIEGIKVMPYMGASKHLLNYIDKLEKSTEPTAILLHTKDPDRLWSEFRSLFREIKAAGGAIQNEQHEILMIDRLQRWDLPKGKLEKGEKKREAAIREVEEETGLLCEIVDKLCVTFHTYRTKKGRVLKKTHWYRMKQVSGEINLQEEEDILDHQWISAEDFLRSSLASYGSIQDVMKHLVLDAQDDAFK